MAVGLVFAPEGTEEVVVGGTLVTSREPDDLDAFCEALVETSAEF